MWYRHLFKIAKQTIFLTFFLSSVWVAAACALDGNEILRQVDENMQPQSYKMYRKLINIEPDPEIFICNYHKNHIALVCFFN